MIETNKKLYSRVKKILFFIAQCFFKTTNFFLKKIKMTHDCSIIDIFFKNFIVINVIYGIFLISFVFMVNFFSEEFIISIARMFFDTKNSGDVYALADNLYENILKREYSTIITTDKGRLLSSDEMAKNKAIALDSLKDKGLLIHFLVIIIYMMGYKVLLYVAMMILLLYGFLVYFACFLVLFVPKCLELCDEIEEKEEERLGFVLHLFYILTMLILIALLIVVLFYISLCYYKFLIKILTPCIYICERFYMDIAFGINTHKFNFPFLIGYESIVDPFVFILMLILTHIIMVAIPCIIIAAFFALLFKLQLKAIEEIKRNFK